MVLSINFNNKKWHSQTERCGTDASISAVTLKAPLWRASWLGRDGPGFRLWHYYNVAMTFILNNMS